VHRGFLGAVAVSYDACNAVLRHRTMSSRMTGDLMGETFQRPMWQAASRWLFYQDGEPHRQVRGLLTKSFTPRSVEQLRPFVADFVRSRVHTGELDVVADLAYPLPVAVLSQMFGVPIEDQARLRGWAQAMTAVVGNFRPTADQLDRADQATLEADDFIRHLLAAKRAHPADDLISRMALVEDDGRMFSDDEIVSNLSVLLGAGSDTTVGTIANSVKALLDFPDQLELLRSRPELVTEAIEELLRYDPAITFPNPRRAVEPTVIAGVELEPGEPIVVLPGAANRDPAHAEDPDRLDILRPDPRPLTFGAGFHFCVGAALARLMLRECLLALVTTFGAMEKAYDTVTYEPSHLMRVPTALPVTLK
jgi:cytochrome P450